MLEERAGFRVTGKVQGVGYRFWARRTGLDLGLRGVVRNAPDGSVEVHVAGPQEAVATFERMLSRGSSGARVIGVARVASSLRIPERGFEIEGSG